MNPFPAGMPIFLGLVLGGAMSAAVAQELHADPAAPTAVVVQVDVDAAAAQVTRALKSTQGLPPDRISVSTHANNIVLTGQVDSDAQRAAALSAAEKAAGGVRISANLEVRPLEDRSPQEQRAVQQSTQLVRDVEAALKADSRTANLGITVSSAAPQKVLLQGLVPTAESRTVVQTVVSKVKGVTQVENRLMVP
jgi:osmotically-inducible protein OsmY